MPIDDATILSRVGKGDSSSFDLLVQRWTPNLGQPVCLIKVDTVVHLLCRRRLGDLNLQAIIDLVGCASIKR